MSKIDEKVQALLLSNSVNKDMGFLEHAMPWIQPLIKRNKVTTIALLAYAAYPQFAGKVGKDHAFDAIYEKLSPVFSSLGLKVIMPILKPEKAHQAIGVSDAVFVTGGNTFFLLDTLIKFQLLQVLRQKVLDGLPYIGWSAGANVAGKTICTTNDMPIIKPDSFDGLNLVPFQLNPHFPDEGKDVNPLGETRSERLSEYCGINPESKVLCLRNGSGIEIREGEINLLGPKNAGIFTNTGLRDVNELSLLFS